MTARSFPRPYFLNIMIVDWFRWLQRLPPTSVTVRAPPGRRWVRRLPPHPLPPDSPRPPRERDGDQGRSKKPQPEKGAG